MENTWKRKWTKVMAVLLVCLLIFQDNVMKVLADTLQIQVFLKDGATDLKLEGVKVTLTAQDESAEGGSGTTTSSGNAYITVSAGEGAVFSVSVDGAGDYVPVDENPEITISKDRAQYELPMRTPEPDRHKIVFVVEGEGSIKVKDQNGEVIPDNGYDFPEGANVEFVLEAAANWHISGVTVDDAEVEKEWGNDSDQYNLEISGGETDHQVQVRFAIDQYILTVSTGAGGMAYGGGNYEYGDEYTIHIIVEDGYNVESVSRNDEDVTEEVVAGEGSNSYVISGKIEVDTELKIQFSPIEEKSLEDAGINFNKGYATVSDGDSVTYFYKNDGHGVTFDPGQDKQINLNGDINGKVEWKDRWTVADSTKIENIAVRKGLKREKVRLNEIIRLVIDKEKPVVDSITEPGWINGACQVYVTVSDKSSSDFLPSGIDYVVYSDKELTAQQLAGGEGSRLDAEDSGKYSFTVSGDQSRTYYVWAVDRAGNVSEAQSVHVKIDQTAPEITHFSFSNINHTSFGSFSNGQIIVTVTAADHLASGEQGSGVSAITLYLEGEAFAEKEADENGKAVFELTAECFSDSTTGADMGLSAKAVDKLGNQTPNFVKPSSVNSDLKDDVPMVIDAEAPVITIEADAPADYTDKEGRIFYANSVPVKIKVNDGENGAENHAGLCRVFVWINETELSQDRNGKNIGRVYHEESKKVYDDSFVLELNQVEAASDGKYVVVVKTKDNAGNETEASLTLYVDQSAPRIISFRFPENDGKEGDGGSPSIEKTSYGFYFQKDTEVTIKAEDNDVSSGIRAITYYTIDNAGNKSAEFAAAPDENNRIQVVIPAEFKGQIYASATDHAGNVSESVTPDGLIIETPDLHNAREHISVTMKDSLGFDNHGNPLYAGDVEVHIAIKDTWSGIRSVNWSVVAPYDEEENQSGGITIQNNGTLDGEGGWDIAQRDRNLVTEIRRDILVSNNSNGIILTVEMTDRAGNTSSLTQTFSIDKTEPMIELTFDEEAEAAVYPGLFKGDRTATIVVTERNFSAERMQSVLTNSGSWLPKVDLRDAAVWEEVWNEEDPDKSTYTVKVPFLGDGSYIWDIGFEDNCGNRAQAPERQVFVIDKIQPLISVTADSDAAYQDDQGRIFFAKPISFTVAASDLASGRERNSGLRAVTVSVNGIFVKEDMGGKDIGRTYDREEEKVLQDQFVIHMNQVPLPEDGRYEIVATVEDNAGNICDSQMLVYLDQTAPSVTGFHFLTEGNIEGDGQSLSALAGDYGFYFREGAAVIIRAMDVVTSSGIKSLTYYTEDADGSRGQDIVAAADKDGGIRLEIPTEFKGQIYARATDRAENISAGNVSPAGIIVESPAKHASEEHITIDMSGSAGTDNSGYTLYSENVTVNVVVRDTWSGIRSVNWSVAAPYDEGENQSGGITIQNNGTLDGEGGWSITQRDRNLVTEISRDILVSNNSNGITLTVEMTDRAGNQSSQTQTFSIDKTAPLIEITFDNETSDAEYPEFFKENRTATIVITERNFNAANVQCEITNTDGWLPAVDLTNQSVWQENRDDGNPDASTYIAQILFSEDGDYILGVGFSDGCGNEAKRQETLPFTIDKTMPRVRVTYDDDNSDNPARNGNYYGKVRTATITVTEHNFDVGRIEIIGTSEDNGTEQRFPETRGWVNRGDEYTTQIVYEHDGKYTFSIRGTDKAGNIMADYETETFYVDLKKPSVKISGVENGFAYNEEVRPVIEITDTNIDRNSIAVELIGVNSGKVEYAGSYEDITNGQRFAYEDFERLKAVDDIYTLKVSVKDYAGHEAVEGNEITFSVNRFGSVYTFDSPKREDILGKYIRQEVDIVLTETNVNELERDTILIKLIKSGVPIDLRVGEDYSIIPKGGENQWCQYTYTIKASLFAEEGPYSVSVYSVDKAGNVNENIADDKFFDSEKNIKAEIYFGIDKTAPVIELTNLEDGGRYDENGKNAIAIIRDNLLLEDVQILLDGSVVYRRDAGDYGRDDYYSFAIPESKNWQQVEIIAVDAAGHESREMVSIMVTTDAFTLWINNTPLFVGTLAGAAGVAGAGGGTGILLFRRRTRRLAKRKGKGE